MTPIALLLLLTAADPIREALVQGQLADAAKLAQERAAKDVDFAGCAAAIVAENGDHKRAAELRKQAKPAPPAPPPVTPASLPKKGSTVYVGASALTLREKASPDGKAVALLPIATPLKVLGGSGAFVNVEAPFPAGPSYLVEDGKATRTGAKPAVGFIAAAFLESSAPDKAALAKAGDLASLERLVALEPSVDAVKKLAGMAYDAGKCNMAAYAAALQAGRLDIFGGWQIDAFQEVAACRGKDRSKTVVVSVPTVRALGKKLPENACAIDIASDPKPCGFCPYDYDADPGDDDKMKEAQERFNAEHAPFEAYQAKLGEVFPEPGGLHVRLRRRPGPALQLFTYSIDAPQPRGGCGEPEQQPPPPEPKEAAPIELPKVRPGEAIDLWLPSAGNGSGQGILIAANKSVATRFLNSAQEPDDPAPYEKSTSPTTPPECCCD